MFSNNAVIKCDNLAAAGQKIPLYCQDVTKKPVKSKINIVVMIISSIYQVYSNQQGLVIAVNTPNAANSTIKGRTMSGIK